MPRRRGFKQRCNGQCLPSVSSYDVACLLHGARALRQEWEASDAVQEHRPAPVYVCATPEGRGALVEAYAEGGETPSPSA